MNTKIICLVWATLIFLFGLAGVISNTTQTADLLYVLIAYIIIRDMKR